MAGLLQSFVPNLSGDVGSATGASSAETCNSQAGIITTEALTTAAGAAETRTLTNSRITAASVVMVGIMGGSNTRFLGVTLAVTARAAGSCTVVLSNNHSSLAINGTIVYWFIVL